MLVGRLFGIHRVGAWVVALTALAAGNAAPATAQHFPSNDEVRQIAQDRVDSRVAVGMVIGMLHEDGSRSIVHAGDLSPAPAGSGDHVLFEIGSITKVFTGILLADMVRRGEVSLDTPVDDLLPESVTMPTRGGREITLLDLATHHSSLPRLPTGYVPPDMSNPYAHYTADMLHDFLSGYELPRDIGSEFEYSNLAVGLQGHALALRAGMPYEQLLKERILDPLGMTESTLTLSPDLAARMSQGHDANGLPTSNWDAQVIAPAGMLRSTASDMLTFLEANLGEPENELERAMRDSHEVQVEMEPGARALGLNWVHSMGESGDIIWHNGGTGGFRAFAGFNPDAGVGVVILSNQAQPADDIGLHLLLRDFPLRAPPTPAPLRESVEVDRSVLERYAGEYRVDPLRVATFTVDEDGFWTQMTGQPRFQVHAASDTVFFLREVEVEIVFELDDDGTVEAIVIHQGGQERRAPRID